MTRWREKRSLWAIWRWFNTITIPFLFSFQLRDYAVRTERFLHYKGHDSTFYLLLFFSYIKFLYAPSEHVKCFKSLRCESSHVFKFRNNKCVSILIAKKKREKKKGKRYVYVYVSFCIQVYALPTAHEVESIVLVRPCLCIYHWTMQVNRMKLRNHDL